MRVDGALVVSNQFLAKECAHTLVYHLEDYNVCLSVNWVILIQTKKFKSTDQKKKDLAKNVDPDDPVRHFVFDFCLRDVLFFFFF